MTKTQATKRVRSRILEHFTPALLADLYRICKSSIISDNNLKVTAMIGILDEYKMDYIELGPGTNRLAILIDNYVFKLALDKWGLQDNINEFTVSQELQPYVVKTYETNDLISVCEYVTVISREEFMDNTEKLRGILAVLAEGYLLGDVGTVAKNFCNWGYRDNGDLVILDFAYIYRVQGEELLCSADQTILEYDENFYNLKCPSCARKYSFMDVRRKISMEHEKNENMIARQLSYKLTKSVESVKDGYTEEDKSTEDSSESLYKEESERPFEEGNKMKNDKFISEEDREKSYLEAMKSLRLNRNEENMVLGVDMSNEHIKTQTIEIQKATPDSVTHIRVFKQEIDHDGDHELNAEDFLKEAISEISGAESAIENREGVIHESVTEEYNEGFSHPVEIDYSSEYPEEVPQYSTKPYVDEQQNYVSKEEQDDDYLKLLDDLQAHPVSDESHEDDDSFEPNSNLHIHVTDADIEIHKNGTVEIHAEEIEIEASKEDVVEEEAFNKDFIDGSDSENEDEDEYNVNTIAEENALTNAYHDVTTAEVKVVNDDSATEAVVIDQTVKLTDTLSIQSTVTIHSENESDDSLRAELANDLLNDDEDGDETAATTFDEEKVDGIVADYMHLQDEADNETVHQRGERNKKNWK